MRIGIIGYGRRMHNLLAMVEKFNSGARIQAIADPNFEAIAAKRAAAGESIPNCTVYRDADSMLASEKLDAVMIGTRCSLHAKMAMKVLAKKLPLYLEKPIATNRKDLLALAAAGKKAKSPVVVSFPLKVSPVVALVKDIIDSGRIGAVETMDAWNDPPYGAVYFREWYRDECETGGLWLQKATHDLDYLTFLAGSHPKQVAALTSKRVFTGNRPAALKCKDCKEWETCLESPFHLYYSRGMTKEVAPNEFYCMFAKDTGNEDAGHALVEFENGVQLSYSQVFMARRIGRRGARIYGYLGTIEFDWFTDEVKVMLNHSPRVETYSVGSKELPHHGGDTVLVWNFLQLAARKTKKSVSPLSEGIVSVNLCLAAGESAKTRTFKTVKPI